MSVLYHVSCTYHACTPQSACHLSWYISAHRGEPVCLICCCNLYVKGTAKLAFLVKRAHYSILSLILIPNIVDFSSSCTSFVVGMLADTLLFFLIASSDQPHFIAIYFFGIPQYVLGCIYHLYKSYQFPLIIFIQAKLSLVYALINTVRFLHSRWMY